MAKLYKGYHMVILGKSRFYHMVILLEENCITS